MYPVHISGLLACIALQHQHILDTLLGRLKQEDYSNVAVLDLVPT